MCSDKTSFMSSVTRQDDLVDTLDQIWNELLINN